MKKLPLLLAVGFASFSASWAQEEVDVLYMSVIRTNGVEISAPLYATDDFIGPKINFEEKRLTIDGRSLLTSRIREIRFSVKTEANAIKPVEVAPTVGGDVYSIDGRLVRKGATSLEGLPKGVYIMNGKKYVVTK